MTIEIFMSVTVMKNEKNHKTATEFRKIWQDPFDIVLKEFVSNI